MLEPVPNLDADDRLEHASAVASATTCAPPSNGFGYPTDIEVEAIVDPTDWKRRDSKRGTPFSLSHRFFQTGPFRPSNLERRVPGLVFVGSSTVPGVGVPMVLVSGELAARRVAALMNGSPMSTALDESYARCRAIDPRPRHHLLLGDGAPAQARAAATCGRCTPSPVTPTTSSTSSTTTSRSTSGPRRSTPSGSASSPTSPPAASDDPLLAAVVAHGDRLDIDPDCFRRFLRSMKMDLTITGYDTWDDLLDYMDGSAAVIGEMMLPVLRPTSPRRLGPARQLGLAFQLTNFLRDVGEDLDRQRIYIPRAATSSASAPTRGAATVDGAWRDLMAFEIDRCRAALPRRRRRTGDAAGRVGALRAHGPDPLLADPRSHRAGRLRRVQRGRRGCRRGASWRPPGASWRGDDRRRPCSLRGLLLGGWWMADLRTAARRPARRPSRSAASA